MLPKIETIQDVRVGHLIKAALACFMTLFVWVMMTSGMAVWTTAFLMSDNLNSFFAVDGIPAAVTSLARMILCVLPPMIIAGIFAADVWMRFYPTTRTA